MSPPSIDRIYETVPDDAPNGANGTSKVPLEPGLSEHKARGEAMNPAPPVFEDKLKERAYLKGKLAAAFRIFGKYGFDEGVAGHITLRDPVDPNTFWVNPFGVSFSLMKSSDLIRIGEGAQILEGGPTRLLNTAAYMIHHAIHTARPDVVAAAHSHSIHGRAFCALGKELDIITQDSCAFHDDHVVYENFNGVVLAEEEGQNIAKCLGNKKAALLQNHGLLTVGHSVEEAVFWFISMEKCCQAQLMADAAGTTKKIAEDDAKFTYQTVGTHRAGWFSAKPLFDLCHRDTGGEYLE
ncbi:MAG: hypothetical protein Q9159_000629 [Coniocarpon cinnabarinum]